MQNSSFVVTASPHCRTSTVEWMLFCYCLFLMEEFCALNSSKRGKTSHKQSLLCEASFISVSSAVLSIKQQRPYTFSTNGEPITSAEEADCQKVQLYIYLFI